MLRDFLKFGSWQHQKGGNNSSRLPEKVESWVQSWWPRTNVFCDLFTQKWSSTAPATKKWGQVIRSAPPVTQHHLSKAENLMLQIATFLRKSAPWPANISVKDVSYFSPAATQSLGKKVYLLVHFYFFPLIIFSSDSFYSPTAFTSVHKSEVWLPNFLRL